MPPGAPPLKSCTVPANVFPPTDAPTVRKGAHESSRDVDLSPVQGLDPCATEEQGENEPELDEDLSRKQLHRPRGHPEARCEQGRGKTEGDAPEQGSDETAGLQRT